MKNIYTKQEYTNNLNTDEFIKIFILKLEKKLTFIFEISEYINNKKNIFDINEEKYLKYYLTINSNQNINYLIKENDYFLENDIITINEQSLKKLMYFLISESLSAIYIFQNFINDENNLFIKLLEELVININSILINTNNNKIFFKNIEILKKYKGI